MSHDRSDLTRPPDLLHERRTGPLRTQRPVYVDLLPPCNHACPAGENIQAWLGLAQAGRFEEAWRTLTADNPLPAVHGRVCYHPCEDSCNRAAARQRGRHPRGRALPRRCRDRARLALRARRRGLGQAGAGGRRRAVGAVGRLPPRAPGPRGRDPRRRAAAGRHDAFRHPRLPHAARGARGRDRRGSRRWASRIMPNHKVADVEAEMTDGRFDACFVAVGAHLSKRTEIPARDAGRMLDAVSLPARRSRRQDAPQLGRGRGLRRRQHRDGRGARGAAARRHGRHDHLPARPRAHAGARVRGRRGRGRGREDPLAAHASRRSIARP